MAITAPQLSQLTDVFRLVMGLQRESRRMISSPTPSQPMDGVLKGYFREHRELGHRDRGLIAETLYAWLRRKKTIASILEGQNPTPRQVMLVTLVFVEGHSISQLGPSVSKTETAWLIGLKAQFKLQEVMVQQNYDWPDWLWEKLQPRYTPEELASLSLAFYQPAPLDLRVNTLKANRQEVLEALQTTGIALEPTSYAPQGLRLAQKVPIQKHPCFVQGKVEVQDEGSQLVSLLVAPKRHEMVADFCAGAGGKTLHLGAQMNSQGRLYAFDVAEKRLLNLRERMTRAGLTNVYPIQIAHENDIRIKRLAGKIDRVLVDAPCTGLGTLRRNPDLRWRQQPSDLADLVTKQKNILRGAACLVKPGGRLVYATCSILAEENEEQVAVFLAEHADFQLIPVASVLAAAKIEIPDQGDYLKLLPHRHRTDGFFAAVFERKKIVEELVVEELAPAS